MHGSEYDANWCNLLMEMDASVETEVSENYNENHFEVQCDLDCWDVLMKMESTLHERCYLSYHN
jgi:hypothetical protein